MILDLICISKDLDIFNQVISRSIYLLSGLSVIDLYNRSFCYLVNVLTDKANIYIKEKFLLYLASFLSLLSPEVFKSNIPHNSMSEQSIKMLTI